MKNILECKDAFQGLDFDTQIFYSLIDISFHSGKFKNTTKLLEEYQNKYTNFKYVPNTAWHQKFSHLAGYASSYYTYVICKGMVLSFFC